MYLSRLRLNRTRQAILWVSNPYRVHQRLLMACDHDSRLLFRIEETQAGIQILVQSHQKPDWSRSFADFQVLSNPPEYKLFNPELQSGLLYRFRLLANPTYKTTVTVDDVAKKKRLGLLKTEDQLDWLRRKLQAAGAKLVECNSAPRGRIYSRKGSAKNDTEQVHLAVLYEGVLLAIDSVALYNALASGIGPAKGYGFGLLSLASTGE